MNNNSGRIANLSTTKLALLARQTFGQVEDILRAEPVAIIGMGCRFPGGADSPQAFWKILVDKISAMSDVPADRWNNDEFYDADFASPGKMNSRKAGFLKEIDQFDPVFFDIPKREAVQMDPQQRLALEVAYEALEDAGLSHISIRGSQGGVFISSYHNDYAHMVYGNLAGIDLRTLTGTQHSITSNRISYLLDLHGPSVTIDTACSSSLVAIHLACQSLRTREADMCLAGGVNTIISPALSVALAKVGFTSPSGHCYTFDAQADGFARGEGCGIVVLKRLADAITDGDRILAVIRGSAVNQDGRSTVLTAPNGKAQQAVVRQAIKNAGLIPSQISHFEAHGTGTHLGDPLEVEALAQVVGPKLNEEHLCYLTSVKANIGHLEAAAGIAGVIKVVLSLQHGAIPAHPTFKKLNPNIFLETTPFIIPTRLTPWTEGEKPRYAGVSSFGVGGTNGHVIIGEAPRFGTEEPGTPAGRSYFLPLSARSPQALIERIQTFQTYLENPALNDEVYDICYTASLRRTHFEYRMGVMGNSREQIARHLSVLQEDRTRLDELVSHEVNEQPPRLAFVFSGQGTQWARMGMSLIDREPVFREVIQQCDAALRPLSGWSLIEKLSAGENESDLDQTEIAQPAIFAIQMALAALWRSWGATPDAVVGHSLGEIAAACSAGILTLADAIFLVYHRGRLMQRATGGGKMVSVDLPWDAVESVIAPYSDEISIAAINSPHATVISGTPGAIDAVMAVLLSRGVGTHPLRVNYAFHSPQMEPFAQELSSLLGDRHGRQEQVEFISTVTGKQMNGTSLDSAYWGKNIRQSVRFADAVENLSRKGVTLFLEISPHPALSAMIEQSVGSGSKEASIQVVSTLRRNQPENETLYDAMGKMYRAGSAIQWKAFFPTRGKVTEFPAYSWQHQRYWLEEVRPLPQQSINSKGHHPLLGIPLHSPAIQGVLYQNSIAGSSPAYLTDHKVFGETVVPASALIEMGLSAAAAEMAGQPFVLEDFFIYEPLLLPETQERSIQILVSPLESGEMTMKVFALRGKSDWPLHSIGKIRMGETNTGRNKTVNLEEIRSRCMEMTLGEEFYARQNATQGQDGVTFGPNFQCVRQIWRQDGEALAELDLPEGLSEEATQYRMHPCLLDAALQPILAAMPIAVNSACFLPFCIGQLHYFGPIPEHVWSHIKLNIDGKGIPDTVTGSVTVVDSDGQVLMEMTGIILKRTQLSVLRQAFQLQHLDAFDTPTNAGNNFYQVAWELAPNVAKKPNHPAGRWVVFADHGAAEDSVSGVLINRIRAGGGDCLVVLPGESYSSSGNNCVKINPALPNDYQKLWREIGGNPESFKVVHLWSLDLRPLDETVSLADDAVISLGSFLSIAKSVMGNTDGVQTDIMLVTRGSQACGRTPSAPEQAMIWGAANTLFLEQPDLNCICVDLDPLSTAADQAECILNESGIHFNPAEREDRIAYNQNERLSARLRKVAPFIPQFDDAGVRLMVNQVGNLDSLTLQAARRIPPRAGEVEIRVLASGLNFRDVLKALGRYPGESGSDVQLGDECAGVIRTVGSGVERLRVGDAVIALASGTFASFVTTTADLVLPQPANLSPEEAASIPIPFLTAWFTLYHLAHLGQGQRVLIHAAAGGVGLAAVQLAQRIGAEIFATAGSPEKRAYLRSMGIQHVLDSRSLDFSVEILALTEGRGVDVVLNSLAGEFIPKSLAVLGPNGCFLEIGKTGILTVEEAARIRPDIAYHPVFLGDVFIQDPGLIREFLGEILTAIQNGELTPLPRRIFPMEAAAEAFRFMARARQIGKIVLTLPGLREEALSSTRTIYKQDATYLITGGLGGIGQAVTRWMVDNGARHLAIVSRKGNEHPDAQQLMYDLTLSGAQVIIFKADTSCLEEMKSVFDQIQRQLPPLRGVIHAAGIVDDGILIQQDWERFKHVLAGKASGAWILHQLTRHLPLDTFVMFSSIAAPLGSPGQSNYAAANAFLGALANARTEEGLPAICIDWGPWLETGMTAQLDLHDRENLTRRGLRAISVEEGLQTLDLLLRRPLPEILVLPVDWPVYLGETNKLRRFFQYMVRVAQPRIENQTPPEKTRSNLIRRLEQTPSGQRRGVLISHIQHEAIRLIGLAADVEVDPSQPLNTFGLDSLMAVEMRNSLSISLGKSLPASLLFDYPTGVALADYLMQSIPWLNPETAPVVQIDAMQKSILMDLPGTTEVAQLSDDEAEAQLMAELKKLRKGKSGV